MNEPIKTLNGVTLSVGQALALRVAIGAYQAFMSEEGLGDDEMGKGMTSAYQGRLQELQEIYQRPYSGLELVTAADAHKSVMNGQIQIWEEAMGMICQCCREKYPFDGKGWHLDRKGKDTLANNVCKAVQFRERLGSLKRGL